MFDRMNGGDLVILTADPKSDPDGLFHRGNYIYDKYSSKLNSVETI